MTKRTPIPAWLRLTVMERDGYQCRYCRDPSGPFHMDHVRPWSWGGLDTLANLVTACALCNLRKGAQQWTPLPGPMAELTSVQRREALELIAGSLGHWPRWQPIFRDGARWWCTCDRKTKYFVVGTASLPAAIAEHLIDAVGVPCDLEHDPHPPMFMDA